MADMIIELASKQRKRLVASVLNAAEKSTWWHKLTERERVEFREKMLASVGVYHDFMLDVIRVSTESSTVNDHALQLIEQVHAQSRQIRHVVDQIAAGK